MLRLCQTVHAPAHHYLHRMYASLLTILPHRTSSTCTDPFLPPRTALCFYSILNQPPSRIHPRTPHVCMVGVSCVCTQMQRFVLCLASHDARMYTSHLTSAYVLMHLPSNKSYVCRMDNFAFCQTSFRQAQNTVIKTSAMLHRYAITSLLAYWLSKAIGLFELDKYLCSCVNSNKTRQTIKFASAKSDRDWLSPTSSLVFVL